MAPFSYERLLGFLDKRSVRVNVKWDGKRLSFTGDIGKDTGGQIIMSFREYGSRGHAFLTDITGGDLNAIKRIFDLWDRWHLNDMRAGCPHQTDWNKRPIDPTKPLTAYGKHFPGQKTDTWNMLSWVSREEHPKGLLSFPCPACGYKYGTKWLLEPVPESVLVDLVELFGGR